MEDVNENAKLKDEIEQMKKKLEDSEAQVIALQKNKIILQSDNEFLSTAGQNS